MGGDTSRMAGIAKKDRFIKKKMEKWADTNGRDPNPIEREELVEQFTKEFFKGSSDSAEQPGPIDERERNIKLRF